MSEHQSVIQGIYEQLEPVFTSSEQPMYIYLGDDAKVCNEKFSRLLGYGSPQEWAAVSESFPTAFVDQKSQHRLISAYQDAMQKGVGSSDHITWKKKTGEPVESRVILVPIVYEGTWMALHFIAPSSNP